MYQKKTRIHLSYLRLEQTEDVSGFMYAQEDALTDS